MSDVPWYIWLLLVSGGFSLFLAFIRIFLASDLSLPDMQMDSCPPVGSDEFLETLALTVESDMVDGGTAELLHNGDGFFPRFYEDVRAAKQTVHVMTYIWSPGDCLTEALGVLTEKAREGVEVRVMADGFGGRHIPNELIDAFKDAGGKFEWFAPLMSMHFINVNQRNHRRAFVIDGRIAYTGGVSFSDEWTGDGQDPEHWKDIMLRLTGPPVVTIQEFFIGVWTNVSGELPFGEGLTPRTAETVEPAEAAIGPGDPDKQPTSGEQSDDEVSADSDGEQKTVFRHLGVGHAPSIHVHPLRQLFWFSIRAAEKRIWINTAYFAPDEFIRLVLREAAKAGRDVRLLTPSGTTDAPFVRAYAHRYYDELMEAGVRVFEYQPTMLHSKYVVVDSQWVVTGSANLDVRSFQLNHECMLAFLSPELAQEMEAVFEADLENATEFDLETWRQRGIKNRLLEKIVLPIWHQI